MCSDLKLFQIQNIGSGTLLLFVFANLFTTHEAVEAPQVEIHQGVLSGKSFESRDGRPYFGFLGIPYAKPPQRFKISEPPVNWTGIRDATEFGKKCIQFDAISKKIVGGEDCLFLNIYTPNVHENYAVMVFIHGGHFLWGSGNEYDGKYFMDENVILVTLNYRLGALGFLNSGDGEAQGNMGLKDQTMALRWIRENIHNFGGDKNQVTIFGESAGAASVALHILSPMSKGLFKYAISQSGSSLNPWVITEYPGLKTEELADRMECSTDTPQEMFECLRKEKCSDIVAKQDLAQVIIDSTVHFGPTLEKVGIGKEEVFLSENPKKLLTDGNFNKVPWIVTICEDEGILMHSAAVQLNPGISKKLNQEWFKVAPLTFHYDYFKMSDSTKNWISLMIKKYYFGVKVIDENNFQNLTNLYSDRLFIHGIQTAALLHAKHSPVFTGIFSYRGHYSFAKLFGINTFLGVTHGDELYYLFNSNVWPYIERDSEDDKISKSLVKTWVNFAKSGNPEFVVGNTMWPPVSSTEIDNSKINWLNFNAQPEILEDPFYDRMQFWNRVLEKLYFRSARDEL